MVPGAEQTQGHAASAEQRHLDIAEAKTSWEGREATGQQ